jgi:hypothetical protein
MPSILSIFSSVVSLLFGIHVDETKLDAERKSINPPQDTDSNHVQMLRYEFTMQLLRNTDIAIKNNRLDKAYEYIVEADRVSGYMGYVKVLYLETCKLIIKEGIMDEAINNCKNKEIN